MIEENSLAEWLDKTATGGYLKKAIGLIKLKRSAGNGSILPYGMAMLIFQVACAGKAT